MQKRNVVIIYFVISIALFIGITIAGIILKEVLIKKFQSNRAEEIQSVKEESENVKLARGIWGVAAIIALIMLILFTISKIFIKKSI